MAGIFPDLLRATVTDIMLVLLLYTMSRPRYSKKSIYIGATMLLVVLNLLVNTYFYLKSDYNSYGAGEGTCGRKSKNAKRSGASAPVCGIHGRAPAVDGGIRS